MQRRALQRSKEFADLCGRTRKAGPFFRERPLQSVLLLARVYPRQHSLFWIEEPGAKFEAGA